LDEENSKIASAMKEKELDFSNKNFNGSRPTNHRTEFPLVAVLLSVSKSKRLRVS